MPSHNWKEGAPPTLEVRTQKCTTGWVRLLLGGNLSGTMRQFASADEVHKASLAVRMAETRQSLEGSWHRAKRAHMAEPYGAAPSSRRVLPGEMQPSAASPGIQLSQLPGDVNGGYNHPSGGIRGETSPVWSKSQGTRSPVGSLPIGGRKPPTFQQSQPALSLRAIRASPGGSQHGVSQHSMSQRSTQYSAGGSGSLSLDNGGHSGWKTPPPVTSPPLVGEAAEPSAPPLSPAGERGPGPKDTPAVLAEVFKGLTRVEILGEETARKVSDLITGGAARDDHHYKILEGRLEDISRMYERLEGRTSENSASVATLADTLAAASADSKRVGENVVENKTNIAALIESVATTATHIETMRAEMGTSIAALTEQVLAHNMTMEGKILEFTAQIPAIAQGFTDSSAHSKDIHEQAQEKLLLHVQETVLTLAQQITTYSARNEVMLEKLHSLVMNVHSQRSADVAALSRQMTAEKAQWQEISGSHPAFFDAFFEAFVANLEVLDIRPAWKGSFALPHLEPPDLSPGGVPPSPRNFSPALLPQDFSPPQDSPESPSQDSPEPPPQDSPEPPPQDSPESPPQDSPESPPQDSPEQPLQDLPESPPQDSPESPQHEAPASLPHEPRTYVAGHSSEGTRRVSTRVSGTQRAASPIPTASPCPSEVSKGFRKWTEEERGLLLQGLEALGSEGMSRQKWWDVSRLYVKTRTALACKSYARDLRKKAKAKATSTRKDGVDRDRKRSIIHDVPLRLDRRPLCQSSIAQGIEPGDYCQCCGGVHDKDKILPCDSCGKAWHLYCLAPRVFVMPKKEWFCADCTEATKSTPPALSGLQICSSEPTSPSTRLGVDQSMESYLDFGEDSSDTQILHADTDHDLPSSQDSPRVQDSRCAPALDHAKFVDLTLSDSNDEADPRTCARPAKRPKCMAEIHSVLDGPEWQTQSRHRRPRK